MKNKHIKLILGVLVLGLVSLACNLSLRDGKLSVPITLREESIKQILSAAQAVTANQGDSLPVIEVQDIEFIEPDKIVASGQYQLPMGQRLDGQVELKFSVVDDKPKVEITGINIPGLDLASDAVKKANEALSQVIQDQVRDAGQDAVIKSITVEQDALKILVEVAIQR
ncbi:MAG: hypothetical protein AB1453_05850 [Chloroflexota bacterium]|jgi:hypothetical protein